jgi:hypothetical protein
MKYYLRAFNGHSYVSLSQYPEIVARNLPDIEVQCRKIIKAMGTLMEYCWMRPLFENEVSDQFRHIMADVADSDPDALAWVKEHNWFVISKTEDKAHNRSCTRKETE